MFCDSENKQNQTVRSDFAVRQGRDFSVISTSPSKKIICKSKIK